MVRNYQVECIAAIHEQWRLGNTKTVFCLPTGAGKTKTALEAVKNFHFLYVVHREFLTEQVASEADFPVSIRSGKIKRGSLMLPVVATIQWLSARNNLERLLESNFDALVIDEAHHATASSYVRLLSKFEGKPVVGMTATLQRTDAVPLSNVFHSLAYFKPINFFIKNKYLSPVKSYSFECDLELRGVPMARDAEDFVVGKKLITAINVSNWKHVVLGAWREHADGLRTIAFCLSVEHSKELCTFLLEQGIPSAHIDASTPKEERDSIIRDFKLGTIRILCNMAIFTEGFDVPSAEAAIMARPTKSQLTYIQCIGRVLRIAPNKEQAVVLDMTDSQHTLTQFADIEPAYCSKSDRDLLRITGYSARFIDSYLLSLSQRRGWLQFGKARDSYAKIINLIKNRRIAWGVFGDRAVMSSTKGALIVFSPDDTEPLNKSFSENWNADSYHVFIRKPGEIAYLQSANIVDAMETVSDIAEQYADNLTDGTSKWRSLPPTNRQMDMLVGKFLLDRQCLEGVNRGEASLIIEYIFCCDAAEIPIGGQFERVRREKQLELERRKQEEIDKKQAEIDSKITFWKENPKPLTATVDIIEMVWMLLGCLDDLNAWEREFITDNAYRLASGKETTARQDEFIIKIHEKQLERKEDG